MSAPFTRRPAAVEAAAAAVAAAFRAAMTEFEDGGPTDARDSEFCQHMAAAVAEGELHVALDANAARDLAGAIALAARSLAWGEAMPRGHEE
jgi:hypothetical protein